MQKSPRVRCFVTQDKTLLRNFLRRSPVESAYLLGDLQEPFFSNCRWLVATYDEHIRAIVLIYEGLSTPCILSLGAPDLIREILSELRDQMPRDAFAKIPHSHEAAFAECCELYDHDAMWCMGLDANLWTPPPPVTTDESVEIRVLTPDDSLEAIHQVYLDYPGNFFEPSQLSSGLYFGGFVQGVLSCVVGTHVYAPNEQVGVLGNIVAARKHRGKGLARAVCGAVVEELQRRGCSTIALHVSDRNHGAIACYRSLGFAFHSTLWDVPYRNFGG